MTTNNRGSSQPTRDNKGYIWLGITFAIATLVFPLRSTMDAQMWLTVTIAAAMLITGTGAVVEFLRIPNNSVPPEKVLGVLFSSLGIIAALLLVWSALFS